VEPAALAQASSFLERADDLLLTAHVNSDGDAIGSCLALQGLLHRMGKSATVILPEAPDSRYDFLAGWSQIRPAAAQPESRHRHVVVLDCPSRSRIGAAAGYVAPDALVLNLDHHADNTNFGDANLVCPDASSSSQIVYHLAMAMALPIDADVAVQLYTGIVFDTGGFRYSLATATTLEVGADLVRRGAPMDLVADRVFGDRAAAEVRQLGQALRTLTLHCAGRVVTMHLTYAQLRSGDPEDVANQGLSIHGVQAAVLMREHAPAQYRVSLRSKAPIDVGQVARLFGGGGHANAAGCRLEGALEEVQRRLVEAIEQRLA